MASLDAYAATIRDPETRAQYRAEWRAKYDEAFPTSSPDPNDPYDAERSWERSESGLILPKADNKLKASPFVWRDPLDIPKRPWVYGRYFLRHTVTAVLAPGGVGKSSFIVSTALALASGRPLLGKSVHGGPKSVWYWNLEDDQDELARQFHAAAILHKVDQGDCGQRLFVDSALDGAELCTATDEMGEFKLIMPVIESIVEQLKRHAIDVLVIDPFVSSHQVDENANTKIDRVVKQWARVAKEADCSIVLVHHTRKLAGQQVSAEHSRGASALVNAARSTLVLNRMEGEEAEQFGISDKAEQRRYFSVRDDKSNRAPPELQDWHRMASVELGNGDNIGVTEQWTPPDLFKGVSDDHLYRCQVAIHGGEWRESPQASQWAGHAVAPILGLDMGDKGERAKASKIIKTWINNGALKTVQKPDEKRMQRAFIVVGEWAIKDDATPIRNVVGQGGARWGGDAAHKPASPPPSPFRGRGGGASAAPVDDYDWADEAPL